MLPMFSYYGSKYQMARRLTAPQRDHVVEPFAGSACYSLYHEPAAVTLIDADPIIAGVWNYLIKASASEIMALPVHITSVDEIDVCQEAKWLVGFWFNCGTAQPSKRRSNWGSKKQFWNGVNVWSEAVRLRIACQVGRIRHWKIIHGNWSDAPNIEAHWHVDPPYCGTKAGKAYKFHDVDYNALGAWCLKRKGFVQVCEAGGADWLPFTPAFARTRGTPGASRSKKTTAEHKQYSTEAVFEVGNRRRSILQSDLEEVIKDDDNGRIRAAKRNGGEVDARQPAKISGKAGASGQRTAGRKIQRAQR